MARKDLPLPLEPALALERCSRLIVLVPGFDADLMAVTNPVWKLAGIMGAHVTFMGMCNDGMQEPRLRRQLISMSAMMNYGNVSADIEVVIGKDWVRAVRSRWQEGDMIVCFDGHRTGLPSRPLSQILQSDLTVPLYILSGLDTEQRTHVGWQKQAVAWLGFVAIILGFFMLQIKIEEFAKNWTILLESLSVAVELWLVWAWNKLFFTRVIE
jgi:hypothetical protein